MSQFMTSLHHIEANVNALPLLSQGKEGKTSVKERYSIESSGQSLQQNGGKVVFQF